MHIPTHTHTHTHTDLPEGDASEFHAKVTTILKNRKSVESNIIKEWRRLLTVLETDTEIKI